MNLRISKERKGQVLAVVMLAMIFSVVAVYDIVVTIPRRVARKQWNEQVWNRIVDMIKASDFDYSILKTPEDLVDVCCKYLYCANENQWTEVKDSLQQMLELIQREFESPYIYVFEGLRFFEKVIRIGIIRDTIGGKVFEGRDIDTSGTFL